MAGREFAGLIGRGRELGALTEALALAAGGHGSLVLLAGPPGIGKSRLLREASHLAEQSGARVVGGRCTDEPTQLGLRPLSEAVLELLRGEEPPQEALGIMRAALAPLLPDQQDDTEGPGSETLLIVGEGIVRLCAAVAPGRPVMIAIEDLHWADPDTLAALGSLAHAFARAPVLCIATLRDRQEPAWSTVQELAMRRAARLIELRPLGDVETHELAAECLGGLPLGADVAGVVSSRSGGIPLLVEELVSAAVATGAIQQNDGRWIADEQLTWLVPETVTAMVGRRLHTVDETTLNLIRAGAVLGSSFDVGLAAAAAGIDAESRAAALKLASDAQIVVAGSTTGTARFRHDLLRDGVLAGLLPEQRSDLAGRALEQIDGGAACDAPTVARLAEDTGQRGRAARELIRLARDQLHNSALASAEATLERATQSAEGDPALTAQALDALLDVLVAAGKPREAVVAGEELLTALSAVGAPSATRADVYLRTARAALAGHAHGEAEDQLERGRALAPDDPATTARLRALSGELALARGRFDDVAAHAATALAAAERTGDPRLLSEALALIAQRSALVDPATAVEPLERLLRISERHGLVLWRVRALQQYGMLDLRLTGRLDRLEEARQAAETAGAVGIAAEVELYTVLVLATHFRMEECLAAVERLVELTQRYRLGLLPFALASRAGANSWLGNAAAMEEAIAEATAIAPDDPEVLATCIGDGRGMRLFFDERLPEALDAFDAAMDYAPRYNSAASPFRGAWALVRTVLDLEGERARDEVRHADGGKSWWIQAFVTYADAIASGRTNAIDAANSLVRTADQICDEQLAGDWLRHTGRRHAAEAALRDGWGTPEAWLEEAIPFFDAHKSLAPMAAASRALMRRAGVPVRRRGRGASEVPATLAALHVSSREMDVLNLVIDGLGNRDIAQRLHLSPRTVEKHIENLLGKTDANSRTELAVLGARVHAAASAESSDPSEQS